ncbi:MAG: sigma-E factor negative regulatory protein [Gammaproteobacteria bacterium]|nr:sigma-E factor negative regulatory protein [Gammaproteobacteria bacterium]
MNEKISAFLDGEVDPEEATQIVRRLKGDIERRNTWSRYHLIGAAIRAEPLSWNPDQHQHILQKIEQEPTQIAPAPGSAQVIKRISTRVLPLALAASLGALAVFGFQLNSGVTQNDALQVAEDRATHWQTNQPEMETALNAFLVEHGEFTPASGMNGLMSYAKFVSYDASQ